MDIFQVLISRDREQEAADQGVFKKFLSIFPSQTVTEIGNCLSSKTLYEQHIAIFETYQNFIEDPNNRFFRASRQKAYENLNKKFLILTEFTTKEFVVNQSHGKTFHFIWNNSDSDYDRKRLELQNLTNAFTKAYVEFVRTANKHYIGIMVWVAVFILFILALLLHFTKSEINLLDDLVSCGTNPIPSVGTTKEYREYSASLETYTDDELGFSFQYPPHLKLLRSQMIGNHVILSPQNDTEDDKSNIIVSIGLNDENMTPEEWLLSPNSGYVQSRDRYGDCNNTLINGQLAVYTQGGMWTVVNTPNNRYRLSIADLTTGEASPLFTEMGIVIESLRFRPTPDGIWFQSSQLAVL